MADGENEKRRKHTEPVAVDLPGARESGAPGSFPLPPREDYLPPADRLPPSSRSAATRNYASGAQSGAAGRPARRTQTPAGTVPDAPRPGSFTYSPDLPLIDSVEVIPWKTEYSYYVSFCSTAAKLADYTADPCEYKPFFSYMPQYSQMDAGQLEYYFYLRDSVREGVFPQADDSYLLLLIYESINLSGVLEPGEILSMLCEIAEGYGESFPRVAMRLSDWICDFCLINRLTLPSTVPAAVRARLASYSSLGEFYFDGDMTDAAVGILLSSSGYSYKKSRYYEGDAAAVFDRYIPGALRAAVTGGFDTVLRNIMTATRVTRDAFVGAICGPENKKKLVVEYRSLSRSHEFRNAVSDLIKYCENRVRAALGLRSRLSVGKLSDGVKSALDGYFESVFPGKTAAAVPEYERLYDPPVKPATTEAAADIESASWETTDRLVSAFADTTPPDEIPEPFALSGDREEPRKSAPDAEEPSETAADFWLRPEEVEFVRACLDGDRSRQTDVARKAGLSPDLIADRINAAALEKIGDVILESDGFVYTVSAYYAEEIKGEIDNA